MTSEPPERAENEALRGDWERAETLLRESEERFFKVVQGAPDGVAILRGTVIVYLNPRAARMLGLDSPEAGYGQRITEFMTADEAAVATARIGGLLETGRPPDAPREYRSRSLDGRELSVEISSIPIDFDGHRAVLAFARDVTERNALQARVARADRLSALGVLSAGVAHEINNPLTYVLLNLEFIERELGQQPDSHETRTLLQRVHEAQHGAERVALIVRDLKTFARDDKGGRGPVRLESVVESALSIVGNHIAGRASVVRRYEDVPPVDGNAARLEQVFCNLLTNAVQALAEGAATDKTITVRIWHEGKSIRASIADTGEGMSEDVKARIFDPFFTTKPPGIGTGLGLPICQSIVRAHGGELSVESAPGRGSTFTLELPAFQGEVEAPRTRPRVPASTERGRVLIVDDDVTVGATLCRALEIDHDIKVVTTAVDALVELAAAQGGPAYDAILCDVLMPGMTGSDLYAAAIRAHPRLEQRFVFMSGGFWVQGTDELGARTGAPILEKPFDLEQVRSALRDVVTRARLEGER